MRPVRAFTIAVTAAAVTALEIPVPPTCSPHCTTALNAAIQKCASAAGAPCTVQLLAGTYVLDGFVKGPRIEFNGVSNVAFQGKGPLATRLILDTIATAFSISGGSNVTLSGFSLDQARVPFTYGQVAAVSRSSFTVVFDSSPHGLYPIDTAAYPWLSRIHGVLSYDPIARRIPQGHLTDLYALPPDDLVANYSLPAGGGGPGASVIVPASIDASQVGTWVVLRHQTYSYNSISASSTAGLTVVGVSLWAAGGMGIYCGGCANITIDGLRIERLPGRPMSLCADGIHLSDPAGAVVVTNSVFEGQGDDGINMPTTFYQIVNVSAGRDAIQVEGRGDKAPVAPVAKGQVLNVFSRTTLASLGRVTVASSQHGGTLVLTQPLPPGAGLWSLVNVAASYASTVQVTGNLFRGNRARGALLKQSNVFASNNTFESVSGPALKTETDGCFWLEGHPVTNWTVVDNLFNQTNYAVARMQGTVIIDSSVPTSVGPAGASTKCEQPTGASPPVQHNLTIRRNVFLEISGEPSVAVFSTAGLVLEENTVTRLPGAVVPAVDLFGAGVTGAYALGGNTCDGRACVTKGLYLSTWV